jgi:hypothetical protein
MEEISKYYKEGQVSESVGSIITLIAGVGVAVLVLIFVGSLGGNVYVLVEPDILAIGNNSILAESFTASNASAASLANTVIQEGTLQIYNTSAGVFALGNFTIDYGAGTVLLAANDVVANGSALLANYTWGNTSVRESVMGGIVSSFNALEQTGDYMPIIVLAVVISLVLVLVLGFSGMRGNFSRGGGAGSAL